MIFGKQSRKPLHIVSTLSEIQTNFATFYVKILSSRSPQPQCGSVRQYLSYCAYGFGIPLTVVTVGVIMDLSYE